MAKIHSPILRLVTGSELSHQQLDDNINSFIYSSSIEGTTLTFYQGTDSGSFTAYQTDYTVGDTTPDGTISGSAQITLLGFISESASGIVSGSSQIFALLSGSTLVSGSVLRPEGDDVVSGSVLRPEGDDVVSGSVLRPTGDGVVSGSLQIASITGSSITSAVINGDDGRKIDFTKGDSSTFSVTVQTGSGGGSTDYISNVSFTGGDLSFTGEGSAFSSTVDLGDLVSGSVLRPEGDDVVSGSVLRPTGDDVVSGSVLRPEGDDVVSGSLQIADITGSVITGAVINGDDGRKIDFTKGDSSTFSVTVQTGSGGGSTDYVSNVTFAAGDLSFTGEGSAFNSTVDLGDIVSGSVLRPEGDDVVSGSVLRPTGDDVVSGSVLRPEGDDVVSGSVLRPEGDNVVSGSLQIADITGSVITGAAINGDDGRKIDFTKGDNSTFSVTVQTGSGGGSTDYISNVTFAAGDLSFTGEGSAFNSTVDLGDIVSGSVLRPEGDDVVSGSVLRPTGDGVFSSSFQPNLRIQYIAYPGASEDSYNTTRVADGFTLAAGNGTYIRKSGDTYTIDSGIIVNSEGNAVSSSIISESAQIDHDQTTNFVAGEHFLQSDITTVGTVTTGDVTAILPDLIVSGSASDVRTFLNVEDGADVTDTTNVTSAGALMDSEVTSLALIKGLTAAQISGSFTGASASFSSRVTLNDAKLTANTSNVTAAGALMDSEVASLALIKGLTAAAISGSGDVRFKAINDATSSYLLNTTDTLNGNLDVTGSISVTGTVTAQEFHTELVSSSIIYESGSTKFGDSSDDNHAFTGSVDVQGDVTAHDYYGGWQGQVISASKVDIDVSGYIDGSGAANEFARFTDSNTLEGLTATQTRTALNVENGADVTDAENVKSNLPAGVPSGSAAQARSQIGAGTGDGTVDTTGSPVDNDFAKFTDANTIEGRSYAEVRSDLGLGGLYSSSSINTPQLDNDAVTYAKIQNIPTSNILGRVTAGTGDVEDLTATQVRTLLNVEDGANNYSHPDHTGDVTSSGDGATTIANDAVTYAKMQNVSATNRVLGRDSAGAGNVEEISPSALRTMINVEDGANNYSHPTEAGDDIDIDTGALTGATVISDLDFNITTNTLGHVTDANASVSTRNLTLANLGYTGATDATNNTGTVDTSGTPANQQIAIFTDSNTISGSTQLKMSTSAGTQGLVVGDDGKANLYLGNVISAATSDVGSRFHMNNQDFYFDFQGDSTQTLFFRDYDGSGGIHTRAQIHFNGALQGYVEAAGGFTTGGHISGSGGLFSGDVTANNFITTSDRDLKSNITPIKEGLETLKKFVSYEYELKGNKDAGFIAQEVQETLPYAVHKSKDGYLAMNTKPIVAHIHKAILELDKRLTDIEDKLK